MQSNSSGKTFHTLYKFILWAVVACAGPLIINAQHQAPNDGHPPAANSMINRMVSLFEWSLEVEFSEADRAALHSQVAGYWDAADAKSIQSVRDILAFEQKMRTWSAEQKRQAQPELKRNLLAHFEQNQSDEMSRLLLAIYRRTHDKSAAAVINVSSNGYAPVADLAGKWQVLHGNSLVGVDVRTGRVGDGNGMIAEYDIKPDGRLIYSLYLQQSNYGCTTRLRTSKTGRVVVEGSRVTFIYDAGQTASEDNCNAKYNYTKTTPASRETFDFRLTEAGGKTQFCFATDQLKDCAVKVK